MEYFLFKHIINNNIEKYEAFTMLRAFKATHQKSLSKRSFRVTSFLENAPNMSRRTTALGLSQGYPQYLDRDHNGHLLVSILKQVRRHNEKMERQVEMEVGQHNEAVRKYEESSKELMKIGRGTGLKRAQRLILELYSPLVQEISSEIAMCEKGVAEDGRSVYGPYMLLLPPEILAVITLDSALNSVLKTGNLGINISTLALEIGDLVETEVCVYKLKEEKLLKWQKEMLDREMKTAGRDRGKKLRLKICRIIHTEEWSSPEKLKLGAALLSSLLRLKHVGDEEFDERPAFIHSLDYSSTDKSMKTTGRLRILPDLFASVADSKIHQFGTPRYLPMLVPPRKWDNKRKIGCYYKLKAKLMRTHSPMQFAALSRAKMGQILSGLNYLGEVPWSINTKVFNVAKEAWAKGILIGEFPPMENMPYPEPEECFRKPSLSKKNKSVDVPIPESEDVSVYDEKYHREMCRRVDKKNSELHSMRCDMNLKIWVAEKFLEEEKIYFPYSLDFRGRAYPVPPNLNHLGADFCRGILLFSEARPLGEKGLFWLKVHLANLFGYNKVSYADRLAWTESHMESIRDSASEPLKGQRWWTTAEEPFQALSACIEIVAAIDSGDPVSYLCRLPIHQDGSCNGLQHYAALGKDADGAAAVNLTPGDKPADVYSRVLDLVLKRIEADSLVFTSTDPDAEEREKQEKNGIYARRVKGKVNRKVIKQTVMTSVYGVTAIGARNQVQARLLEVLVDDPSVVPDPETEKEIFAVAGYVSSLTLSSLAEMFESAKLIMDWLSECAAIIAQLGQPVSWVTPLGLPVVQPYRRQIDHVIITNLQRVTLSWEDDNLPPSVRKQRSAFPPNFVHSLDATHMIMTALKMQEKGITFAAVHDSYWTHACHVDSMNEALRDCFVDLYSDSNPVLEMLRESFELRYPAVNFPPLPERGRFDISLVKKSTYFFH